MSPLDSPTSPILYVDDEERNLLVFQSEFGNEFDIACCSSGEEAMEVLDSRFVAVLLTDQRMPGISGIDLCERVRDTHPHVIRLLVTAYSDERTAIEAINRGEVLRYLTKPWHDNEVRQVLRDALERFRLERTVRSLRTAVSDREQLAGRVALRSRILYEFRHLHRIAWAGCQRLERWLRDHGEALSADAGREIRQAIRIQHQATVLARDLFATVGASEGPGLPGTETTDLEEAVEAAVSVAHAEQEEGPRPQVEVGRGIRVQAPAVDVKRIVLNALRFARLRGDGAGTGVPEIRLEGWARGGTVFVRLWDDAPPWPEDRFRDALETSTLDVPLELEDPALALAVAHELAVLRGGDLELEREGPPFTLLVTLPLAGTQVGDDPGGASWE